MAFQAIFVSVANKSAAILSEHLLKVLLNIESKLNVVEKKLTKIQQSPYIAGIELLT